MAKSNYNFLMYGGTAILIGLLVVGGWFVFRGFQEYEKEIGSYMSMPSAGEFHKSPEEEIIISEPPIVPDKPLAVDRRQTVLHNVPFTSQAPSGDWDNIIFQQGCEETSMLMAMLWVQNKKFINVRDAEIAISAISNFSQKNYGEFRDTSIEDTAIIMKDYFDYQNIEVQNDVSAGDIKRELARGNLVIVAVNGQKVGNPFYTPPGPLQHMLVVKGYDEARKEFITNDPGTRRGASFRYKEDVLEGALQDYVTGYKEPISEVRKAMIIVKPR